ncbi:HET-domain-containing protein [Acephala macrosclerotiorum]|nr:HET-domain-containing protein [Acephala macrosclerotiorum]
MRLINVNTYEIQEFIGTNIPPYAILSHTWGSEEVTLQDWQDTSRRSLKVGFAKIQGACDRAREDGYRYVWVDTNCIDKTSSAELSEAINSMFAWYRDAGCCYVYLADVPDAAWCLNSDGGSDGGLDKDLFCRSKWFTRGWTLQELLAPENVVFFSQNWKRIGTKVDFKTELSQITGIGSDYLVWSLEYPKGPIIWEASVAKRMSWMSKRVTTRIEDLAYCMLGIFDINIPLLYGEGQNAFIRLQEEILRTTDDQSIFCWEWDMSIVTTDWASVLAPCPAVFKNSGEYFPNIQGKDPNDAPLPYSITNVGLSIHLPLVQTAHSSLVLAVLQVRQPLEQATKITRFPYFEICIPLAKGRIYRRVPFPTQPLPLHVVLSGIENHIYIVSRARRAEWRRGSESLRHLFYDCIAPKFDAGFLLTSETTKNELFKTNFGYCTPGVVFDMRKSVLRFSFGLRTTAESFEAGIFDVAFGSLEKFVVILAIKLRQAPDGSRTFKYYCQVVPRRVVSRHRLAGYEDLVQEAEGKIMDMEQDIDFSSGSDGDGAVSLGNMVDYSSSHNVNTRQFVRVVYIMARDRLVSGVRKQYAGFSTPLFGDQ